MISFSAVWLSLLTWLKSLFIYTNMVDEEWNCYYLKKLNSRPASEYIVIDLLCSNAYAKDIGCQLFEKVWLNCILGEYQIGDNIKPFNPDMIASVVYYGRVRFALTCQATGHSLIYSQLYPYEGLQNYTSGIIHHVRLTGIITSTDSELSHNFQFNLDFSKHSNSGGFMSH